MAEINELIDKQDTFEIVRDQIAAILAIEIANQQVLAAAAAEDPEEWRLKIFTERSNPWGDYLNAKTRQVPIVNVQYDTSSFNENASGVVDRQDTDGVYFIDCYGHGISKDETTGHTPGDQLAAFEAQRAVRLVRNILMAAAYTYLGLRGTVGKRWPQSVEALQVQQDNRPVSHVVAARLTLRVKFNEVSPQVDSVPLETLFAQVNRQENGEILFEAEYDLT